MKQYVKLSLLLVLAFTNACHSYTNALKVAPKVGGEPNEQMRQVLDALHELNPKQIDQLNAKEARLQPTAADAVLSVLQKNGDTAPQKLPPVGKVEMSSFVVHDGAKIALRVYSPAGKGPFPTIVYYHGGGWVIANLDTYDSSARVLSSTSKAVVVSVDYRRAPEFKFPTAHEDSYEALQFVSHNQNQFNGNGKVAVVGESAGGNLATAVCMMALARKGAMPLHQTLIYPVTSSNFDSDSYRVNADKGPLNKSMMEWFFAQYLTRIGDYPNPLISPLQSSYDVLSKLPPATIVTASIDPLQSEGVAYAKNLARAGVDVQAVNFEGVTHEFFGMGLVVDEAMEAEKIVSARLKDSFNK